MDKNWLFWRYPWFLTPTLQGVQGPTVGEWIRTHAFLGSEVGGSSCVFYLCILTYGGDLSPTLRLGIPKLSCLNNWFLARTCLSKLLFFPPSLPSFVGCLGFQRGLGGPREVFLIHWAFPNIPAAFFPASPDHGCHPKEAGDRGGWGLWEDLPSHRLQQGPVPQRSTSLLSLRTTSQT